MSEEPKTNVALTEDGLVETNYDEGAHRTVDAAFAAASCCQRCGAQPSPLARHVGARARTVQLSSRRVNGAVRLPAHPHALPACRPRRFAVSCIACVQ